MEVTAGRETPSMFPKKEIRYRTYPHVARLYGRGFALYGLLEDLALDRLLAMGRARARIGAG
jgi:hypothetical protein